MCCRIIRRVASLCLSGLFIRILVRPSFFTNGDGDVDVDWTITDGGVVPKAAVVVAVAVPTLVTPQPLPLAATIFMLTLSSELGLLRFDCDIVDDDDGCDGGDDADGCEGT